MGQRKRWPEHRWLFPVGRGVLLTPITHIGVRRAVLPLSGGFGSDRDDRSNEKYTQSGSKV